MVSVPQPNMQFKLQTYWPVLLGLLVLIAPTIYRLADQVWPLDEQAHGPIIVAVVIYLLWKERDLMNETFAGPNGLRYAGWLLLLGGSFTFIIGRSQDIIFFEVLGQIAILAALIMVMFGLRGLQRTWFPIVFLVFMLPLPGFIVDQLTGSLKMLVSEVAANLMHWIGLPIARDGVLLQIGQYKLLVADACSGLYSESSICG
jgi:exosortase